MKAIVVQKTGGPEELQPLEVKTPEPAAGQVRVKVEYSGVNYIDVYHRTGLYALPLPFTPGSEAAGTIDALGDGVGSVREGDRVAFAQYSASYATYAIVPESKVVLLSQSLTTEQAAAAMLQGLTAHYLLRDSYRVKNGDRILVHAAAGGVGLLLTQIAHHLGAFVIGTVSTEKKAATVREAGADETILYTETDFSAEVKRITNGKGLNAVYDSVGQSTFERSLDCLMPRGMLVLFGQSSGPVPPFNPGILATKGSLFLTRPTLAHYTLTREELMARCDEIFGWISEGVMKIRIDSTFPLDRAGDAHRRLESRASSGKILLKI